MRSKFNSSMCPNRRDCSSFEFSHANYFTHPFHGTTNRMESDVRMSMSNADRFDVEASAELISADAQLTIVRYCSTSWNIRKHHFLTDHHWISVLPYDRGARGANIPFFLGMFVVTLPCSTAGPDPQI